MLRDRQRREWRIELRDAALERKGLKERIEVLEARLARQKDDYEAKIADMQARSDVQLRLIEKLMQECQELGKSMA